MSESPLLMAESGPQAAYAAMVAAGSLQPDGAQASLVEHLQALHVRLQGYSPPSRIRRTLGSIVPGIIPHQDTPKGLYIYGGVGRGKSMLMDLFFDSAPIVKKQRIHFHAFMQDIHSRVHTWRQQHKDEDGQRDPVLPVARHIRDNATLLCLDELEVHDVADAMILARLFSLLFKRGVVPVITSNRAPRELYPHGLQRDRFLKFVDLMEQKIEVVQLASPIDYRLEKLQAMGRMTIHPLDDNARKFIQDSFDELTHHATPQSYDLKVQGRVIPLRRTASGVAWCSFQELCAQPLGTKDYITLAEEFHTLLLEQIPELTPENRNEARRFVTLVDALYEHKVKLITSSAVPFRQLYTGGDGSFEFQRTVSRLEEMQSADYLALPHKVWESDKKAS